MILLVTMSGCVSMTLHNTCEVLSGVLSRFALFNSLVHKAVQGFMEAMLSSCFFVKLFGSRYFF
jgi:hypothetical protein